MIYINNPESTLYGKVYYGQHSTNNLNDGYIGSGKIIKNYIKKYPDGYYRKILQLYSSAEELDKAEYELIKPHLGKDYCLNLCDGGGVFTINGHGRNKGKHLPEETKQKQSVTRKQKCQSGEIVVWNKNKSGLQHASEETKKKLSEANKGEKNGMYGRCHSEETKKKISEVQKNREHGPISEEHKMALINSHLGKHLSEETKQKMSASLKGRKAWNKGIKGVIKNGPHSEETKQKMSEARKKYWENKRNGQNTIRNT
jgi:hypothetical protein